MIIQGAFVNVNIPVSAAEFVGLLSAGLADGHCYVVDPPPGIVMTASIDWRLILRTLSDAPLLAAALWDAYESVISPLGRAGCASLPGILVQIKNHRGAADQFVVGGDIVEKEVLAHRMRETIRTLTPRDHAESVRREIEETEGSGFWEQVRSRR